jgi:hypothetical protein
MGWTEAQFFESSPRYFFHSMRAFQKKQEADAKANEQWQKMNLEVQRRGYSYLVNFQLEVKDRKEETTWFPFPWDEIPTPKEPGDVKKEADDFIKEKGYDQGIPIEEFFK